MDGATFDRLAKTLVKITERRNALKAAAGIGIAALGTRYASGDTEGKKKKRKKKDRKLGQTCGGRKKCSKKKGPVACQEFPSSLCEGVTGTGNRCCGLEGTLCDPTFGTPIVPDPKEAVGNCSCCEPLFCGQLLDGEFRCQVEPT